METNESRRSFDEGREGNLFPLVEALDELYRITAEKSPFPRRTMSGGSEESDLFRKCFFVCHRSLLSAAMATGSGLPEDGEAVTRRALEAAKTCFAIKAAPTNLEKWLSDEARLKRWRMRGEGQKPDSLSLNYSNVQQQPLFQEVMAKFGELSDFSAHFTPDYFGRYDWEENQAGDGGVIASFGLAAGAIELGFLMLSKHHELIIRVFDHCQDGAMLRQAEVARAPKRVYELHEHFRQLVQTGLAATIPGEAP